MSACRVAFLSSAFVSSLLSDRVKIPIKIFHHSALCLLGMGGGLLDFWGVFYLPDEALGDEGRSVLAASQTNIGQFDP